jgi:hypothetical protein
MKFFGEKFRALRQGTAHQEAKSADQVVSQYLDMNQFFTQVVDDVRPLLLAQGKEIVLNAERGNQIYGDPQMMARAFSAVLKTIVSHSDKKTAVNVEAFQVEGRTSKVNITSRGKKIPDDMMAALFQDQHAAAGTMGLDLAIAQEIFAMHNGSLTGKSEEGMTVFSVSLPLPARADVVDNRVSIDSINSINSKDSGDVAANARSTPFVFDGFGAGAVAGVATDTGVVPDAGASTEINSGFNWDIGPDNRAPFGLDSEPNQGFKQSVTEGFGSNMFGQGSEGVGQSSNLGGGFGSDSSSGQAPSSDWNGNFSWNQNDSFGKGGSDFNLDGITGGNKGNDGFAGNGFSGNEGLNKSSDRLSWNMNESANSGNDTGFQGFQGFQGFNNELYANDSGFGSSSNVTGGMFAHTHTQAHSEVNDANAFGNSMQLEPTISLLEPEYTQDKFNEIFQGWLTPKGHVFDSEPQDAGIPMNTGDSKPVTRESEPAPQITDSLGSSFESWQQEQDQRQKVSTTPKLPGFGPQETGFRSVGDSFTGQREQDYSYAGIQVPEQNEPENAINRDKMIENLLAESHEKKYNTGENQFAVNQLKEDLLDNIFKGNLPSDKLPSGNLSSGNIPSGNLPSDKKVTDKKVTENKPADYNFTLPDNLMSEFRKPEANLNKSSVNFRENQTADSQSGYNHLIPGKGADFLANGLFRHGMTVQEVPAMQGASGEESAALVAYRHQHSNVGATGQKRVIIQRAHEYTHSEKES